MIREPLFPVERRERVESDSVQLEFAVPDDYAYVDGHFPGNPIVPGVAQIGWALAACRLLKTDGDVSVSKYRFVRPIRPGSSVRVEATRSGEKFACRVFADGEPASKGTILLASVTTR